MYKRIKPADLHPKAGQTIPLVVTRTVEVPADQISKPAANQKHGKLNYQAKPKKPVKVATPGRHREQRKTYGRGQYIGNGEQLTTFVWLDEELMPKVAANE